MADDPAENVARSMPGKLTIRPAAEPDLPTLVDIYNHYVVNTAITFDTKPFTVNDRRDWFERFRPDGRHRLLVAERHGAVIGYASSSPLKSRAAVAQGARYT